MSNGQQGGNFSIDAFAGKIKTQYPVYASVDNRKLVGSILEKYPVYKSQLKTDAIESLAVPKGQEAVRGAAQATGMHGVQKLTGKEGMSAALDNPLIKDLQRGEKAAGAAAEAEGSKAIWGLIGRAFQPIAKTVPVAGKILDAQGNPIVREVEEMGESAAKRAFGMTKDAIKNVIKWTNANPIPSYAIFKMAEQLGLDRHKAMKMLHVVSKD